MTIEVSGRTITLQLYNTESRKKEPFQAEDQPVRMYTCGPTVYHYAHIGNYRTYVFEDLLRKTMQYFGLKVTQVMNITDVDDKTIRGAIEKGVTLDAFTEPFKKAFFEDLKALNIQCAEYYPEATEYIEEMIQIIKSLLEKSIAYVGGDGSIYYAIRKFPSYGRLSHLHLTELKAGASQRVDADEYEKDNVSDFVLWKKYDPVRDGEIFWESPFGPGRPGWHLECSAMAMKILGQTIDLHVGGVDNIFPHHENEIAQSEAHSGKPFVKHWMHSEHLVVNNKKMSKSLGNFYTLRDILERGYTGIHVRYMLLQTHYKTQLNFTFEGMEGVKHALERLNGFIQRMLRIVEDRPANPELDQILSKAKLQFAEALGDDLNISVALAAVFDMVREINSFRDRDKMGNHDAKETLEVLKHFDSVLGVLNFEKQEEVIPQELQKLLEQRMEARKNKDWTLADKLREDLTSRGYLIEDTPKGPRLKKIES